MINLESNGSFKNLEKFLSTMSKQNIRNLLSQYAQEGVNALARATPKDSGLTATSWSYNITVSKNYYSITWTNSNIMDNGVPLAILLQYGHGTKNGGYVQGEDFINPALKPIFNKIADNVWKAVTSA